MPRAQTTTLEEAIANGSAMLTHPDIDDIAASVRSFLKVDPEIANSLQRVFGYVPQPDIGEQWVVYRDNFLLVIHPDRLARMYERGSGGKYSEIDPVFWR